MNAKNKAKDIFNKMAYALRTDETHQGYYTNVIYAKECATVAVYEQLDNTYLLKSVKDKTDHARYWREVRDELNKLL
jgi:hypothetical protein